MMRHSTLIACCSLLCAWPLGAQTVVQADEVVQAMERQAGVTPGQRRNHFNGVCVAGQFVGDPAATAYSNSPIFTGQSSVIGRFSLAGASPQVPDTARNPRGMALQLQTPQGQLQHFTLLNVPVFGAATPQSFLDNVRANTPDPGTGKPDPAKQAAFRASHPDARALGAFLGSHLPVRSYGSSDYHGIHAFWLTNDQGQKTLAKWRFDPRDGVQRLSEDELTRMPTRFLDQTLFQRLQQGPLQWDMVLIIGQSDDEQTNPTVAWPASRPEVHAGVLTLQSASPQAGAACEPVNFDPLVLTQGIAPTNDPVLLFRSGAYAASFAKRITGR
jgi:catalase